MNIIDKHKKYRVLANYEDYSLVSDVYTGEEHSCFYLSEHEVGDEVILYEKEDNVFNGQITFNYSILNLYKKGESYTFEILDRRENVVIISNFPGLKFVIPNTFLTEGNESEITLEIYDLDLVRNRLKFKNIIPEIDLNQKADYSVFEEGEVYELEIYEIYNNKGGKYIKTKYEGETFHVKVPDALSAISLEGKVPMWLGTFKDGNPRLLLTRKFILDHLYKIGEKYFFTLEEIKEHSETGVNFWLLKDEYGFYSNYYPDQDVMADHHSFYKVNDVIELYVYDINERGFLRLYQNVLSYKEKSYKVEEVFEAIGFANLEKKYFYIDKDLGAKYLETEEEDEKSYLDQYKEDENLWVFSYLTHLNEEAFKSLEEGDYTHAKTLLDIYIRIEKWILEKSDYLTNFSDYKIPEIINKAEYKIERFQATLKAIDLFLEDKYDEFLDSVIQRLETSPYLNQETREILKQLVVVSQFFSTESENDKIYEAIIILINKKLINENDSVVYFKTIDAKIKRVKEKVLETEELEYDEENRESLQLLIRNLYLIVLLNNLYDNQNNRILHSVYLLRYLTIYHKTLGFLDLAIELISRGGYLNPNARRHPAVLEITIEEFKEYCIYPEIKESYYNGSGYIHRDNKGLTFMPLNVVRDIYDRNKKQILKEKKIYVKSDLELQRISTEKTLEELIRNANYILTYNRAETTELTETTINYSKVYTGRIKVFHSSGVYCFLECNIEGQNRDILFHASNFYLPRMFSKISDFLRVGDHINFKITHIEEGKINIEAIPYKGSNKLSSNKKFALAKVIYKKETRNVLISEHGLPVVIYDLNLQEEEVLMVEIGEYKAKYNHFVVDSYSPSDLEFPENIVEIFRNHLISYGFIDEKSNSVDAQSDKVDFNDLQLRYSAIALINCLEQRLSYIEDQKELVINYFLIAAISGIVKSSKSYLYTTKLKNLSKVIALNESRDLTIIQNLITKDELLFDFKELKDDTLAIELLRFLNSDTLEIPHQIPTSSKFFKLKKLIEANNLFYSFKKENRLMHIFEKLIVDEFYNLILKKSSTSVEEFESLLLATDDEKNEKTNFTNSLGKESKFKEFKSSLFYSSSDEPQDEIILRTICGFLNAYEGTGRLYIGVDDAGNIIGLKEDLKYSKHIQNLDHYQNYLQSRIAGAFPKTINALIDFEFHKSGNKDYLEIIIPSYPQPVPLKDEFFQRQGVQTRILKGQDLIDFMYRKAHLKLPENKENKKIDLEVNQKLGVGRSDGKENEYTNEYSADKNKITPDRNSVEIEDLLIYLYFYENNTYELSLKEKDVYLYRAPLLNKYRTGFLLLCYDNACVNKMEIQSVISKNADKKYKNALSQQGELMVTYCSVDKGWIGVISEKSDKEYLKIYSVSDIATHRVLGLKGNQIVQGDFDRILAFAYLEKLPSAFEIFRRSSRQGLGTEVKGNNRELFEDFKKLYLKDNLQLIDSTIES